MMPASERWWSNSGRLSVLYCHSERISQVGSEIQLVGVTTRDDSSWPSEDLFLIGILKHNSLSALARIMARYTSEEGKSTRIASIPPSTVLSPGTSHNPRSCKWACTCVVLQASTALDFLVFWKSNETRVGRDLWAALLTKESQN
jgi:hypothetical protein